MTGVEGTTHMWKSGWWFLKAVYLIVASFVFSYIFWWTKGLVEKSCKGKKKK